MCTSAYSSGAPDEEPVVFNGKTHGSIVEPRYADADNFGWDPVFQPDGSDLTYAEMDKDAKNAISHR